jgi:hypothetical protein
VYVSALNDLYSTMPQKTAGIDELKAFVHLFA